MEFTDIQIVFFAVVLLVVVNVGSAIAVWWDKRRASKGQWRVKEETLLVWALVGGWPGGIWAMRRFRHKTSKRSFIVKYVFVVVLNLELSLRSHLPLLRDQWVRNCSQLRTRYVQVGL